MCSALRSGDYATAGTRAYDLAVAVYEYQCLTCDDVFEVQRPMGAAAVDVSCPQGHAGVRRRFSVFAAVGSRDGGAMRDASPAGGGGGCCGGACGCR